MLALNPIIRRLTVLCNTIVSQDVIIDAWPSQRLVLWQHIVAGNLTTAGTRIEILLRRGSREYLLHRAVAPNANTSVEVSGLFLAPGDFRVVGRFLGAAVGDTLELYAYGVVVPETL